jgi:hypothetical protein
VAEVRLSLIVPANDDEAVYKEIIPEAVELALVTLTFAT